MQRLIPWVTCLIILWCRISPAQETAAPAAASKTNIASKTNVTPTVVEEIEPSVYYVQDKDGRLVPMFGFGLEDFMRAFKQLQGLDRKEVPPRFVIEEMSAEGKVVGRTAELSIRFSVRLREEGPIRVPLGLSEAVVRQTDAGGAGAGDAESVARRQLLEHTGHDGYVVWLDGNLEKPGDLEKSQEVSFDVLIPLKTVGSETSLRLQAPRATKSELRLTVPLSEPRAENSKAKTIRGRVSEGATLESLDDDGKGMEFVARGLSSNFELSWHDSEVRTTRKPTVLTVIGQILARINEHSVNTEATLEVSGHGSAFDRFRVRLPLGAELLASSPPGHTVVEVPTAQQVPATRQVPAARQVEIHLPKKTLGPVNIRLATRQSHGQDNSGRLVELCGFEVEGAARQSGHIALAVADDIHVSWNQQYRVRQVDDLPDALRHEDVVAGFAYSSQPCSLNAWVVPRRTRLSVEPEYIIFVDGNGLRLESTLRYMVRGKKAFLLEVDLADWELDEVGPATIVAADGLDIDKSNILRIPLLRRSAGKIEITLKAHRRLPGKTTQKEAHRRLPAKTTEATQKKAHRSLSVETMELKLRLPSPRVSTSSSAAVVIQPADNVELIPNDDANVELTRQQVTSVRHLPNGYQQRPLFYRGEASKAVFVGERSIHPRKVVVDVESRAILDQKACRISQRFSYRIDYQPLRFLEIDVPRTVAAQMASQVTRQGELEFEVGGRKVVAAASTDKSGQEADSDSVAMTIPLDSPGRIGQVELVVRYPLRWKELPPRSSDLREIPLVMPRNAKVAGNRLSVRAEPPLKVSMYDETWTLENGAETPKSQRLVLELSNPNPSGKAVVAVHCEERSQRKSTVVRKAWICTDLTGRARQDWAAFLVYCGQANLDVFLPRGVRYADVDLFLDGKSVRPKEASENQLRLALPTGGQSEHLLELRYHCPGDRPAAGRMPLDLPRIGNDVWNQRLYWELILPHGEHVMLNPPGFVSEYTWGWNGFFWGQKPVCSRDYLADWMGVWREGRSGGKTQLPGEPDRHGTNRYVFSSLGTPASCEYYTIGRSWIVLWASFAALVVGLVLIYVPLGRHPAVLLAAGLGLLALGLVFPAATLPALQAAALGLALALMAGLLQRCLVRRRHSATILDTGSSILDKDSTQTQHIVPTPPVDSTTSGADGRIVEEE